MVRVEPSLPLTGIRPSNIFPMLRSIKGNYDFTLVLIDIEQASWWKGKA